MIGGPVDFAYTVGPWHTIHRRPRRVQHTTAGSRPLLARRFVWHSQPLLHGPHRSCVATHLAGWRRKLALGQPGDTQQPNPPSPDLAASRATPSGRLATRRRTGTGLRFSSRSRRLDANHRGYSTDDLCRAYLGALVKQHSTSNTCFYPGQGDDSTLREQNLTSTNGVPAAGDGCIGCSARTLHIERPEDHLVTVRITT
jgi:hypothetical protein